MSFSWPPFLFNPHSVCAADCCVTKNKTKRKKNRVYKYNNVNRRDHFDLVQVRDAFERRVRRIVVIIISNENQTQFPQVFLSTVSVAVLFDVKKIYVIERDLKTGTSDPRFVFLLASTIIEVSLIDERPSRCSTTGASVSVIFIGKPFNPPN